MKSTRPLQSKPPAGLLPPQRYGVPTRAMARNSTSLAAAISPLGPRAGSLARADGVVPLRRGALAQAASRAIATISSASRAMRAGDVANRAARCGFTRHPRHGTRRGYQFNNSHANQLGLAYFELDFSTSSLPALPGIGWMSNLTGTRA